MKIFGQGMQEMEAIKNGIGMKVRLASLSIQIIQTTLFLLIIVFVHSSEDGGDTWEALYVKPEERNNIGNPPPKEKTYQSNGLENTGNWHLTFGQEGRMFMSLTDLTGAISDDGGQSWSFNYNIPHYNTIYQTLIHPETGVWYAAVSTLHDLYQTTTIDDRINSHKGAILFSTDEGRNWEILKDFNMPVIWMAFDPNNSKTMYASVLGHDSLVLPSGISPKKGGIYKTINLNANEKSIWGKLTNPPRTEGHPYTIIALDDGSLVCSYSAREYPEKYF